jgi:hypothetical protein
VSAATEDTVPAARHMSCLRARLAAVTTGRWVTFLGISRAGPGFGPGPKKPELKFPDPSPARPDLRAYKLDPNPPEQPKARPNPTSPARTRLKICFMQAQAWPDPTFGLQNQAQTRPDVQARAGPFGPGCPCPAAVPIAPT